MHNTLTLKRKDLYQRLGLTPLLVAVLFLVAAIPIYGYGKVFGLNLEEVGQWVYSTFSVGSGTYSLFMVGGYYSSNDTSNTLAQSVLPLIGVVIILIFGLKAVAQLEGLDGFIKTMMIFVLGAILLGAVVVILGQLT